MVDYFVDISPANENSGFMLCSSIMRSIGSFIILEKCGCCSHLIHNVAEYSDLLTEEELKSTAANVITSAPTFVTARSLCITILGGAF
jgi:hypothetical protein